MTLDEHVRQIVAEEVTKHIPNFELIVQTAVEQAIQSDVVVNHILQQVVERVKIEVEVNDEIH